MYYSTIFGGKTALILASWHYNKNKSCCECVKFLLKAGADVNRKDLKEMFTSLMRATRFGCKHCVELLLNKGADVNIFDAKGNGALVYAIRSGKDMCLASIIAAGADVNKTNEDGESPISLAADILPGNIQYACLDFLISAGADVNTTDENGNPIINIVSRRGGVKELGLLIEAGTDVNSSDEYNNTPLIIVARNGISHQVKKVALLLRSGANINMHNKSDFNALTGHIDSQRNCVTKNVGMEMNMLLFAAGEIIENSWLEYVGDDQYIIGIEIHVPDYLLNTELKFCLKHLCREAIRKHLLHLDPHRHLFGRVPRIGHPSLVTEYLLYNQTLDDYD